MNSPRFNWLAAHRNTVREIMGTWRVSRIIAMHIQGVITAGASEAECFAISAASAELCSQVGF